MPTTKRWPENLFVSLSTASREKLELLAEARMSTMSAVMREAIEFHLKDSEVADEIAAHREYLESRPEPTVKRTEPKKRQGRKPGPKKAAKVEPPEPLEEPAPAPEPEPEAEPTPKKRRPTRGIA